MNSAYTILKEQFETKPLVGAEIGVLKGDSAAHTLNILNIEKLYLIDTWAPYEERGNIYDYTNEYKNVVERFKDNSNVIIKKQSSVDAAKEIEDESLDFVYIDACHDYEKVKEDINVWFKKVKKGGLVCGDDCDNWWIDVKKAVKEFAKENKYEVFQVMCLDYIAKGWIKGYVPGDWVIKKEKEMKE